ncbi:hypothetical protein BDF19DRAFT_432557 [Syncephalis fuscata]|nr:hypothetical protein BDF19DRAFT_432557 [Syncephalis fuscata]
MQATRLYTSRLVVLLLLSSCLPSCTANTRTHPDHTYVIYLVVAAALVLLLSIFYFCISYRRPLDADIEHGESKKAKNQRTIYRQIKSVPDGVLSRSDGGRGTIAIDVQSSCDGNSPYEWTGRAHSNSLLSCITTPESFYAPPIKQCNDAASLSLSQVSPTKYLGDMPLFHTKTSQEGLLQVPPPIKQKYSS